MLKISFLPKNSIAYKCGLRADDIILAFDGKDALDMLDVAYFDSLGSFEVTVLRAKQTLTFKIKKHPSYGMEWDFYEQCYIEPRWCANKCVFCFVDQLPKDQRQTLYIKDDDWRLSFVSGNYVTLTNLSQKDIDRIVTNKFSPLYISVHATDDDVRRNILGNSKAQSILPMLQKFAQSGIVMHTQVVMVAGMNDGEILQKTMQDLGSLFPNVATLAVVPVGLTKFRDNLPKILPISQEVAKKTVEQVEKFDREMVEKFDHHFVYCSDEMYIYANLPLPEYEYYGDFSQMENGVGLIADLRYQFNLAFCDAVAAKKQKFTIVTGVSAAPFLRELVEKAKNSFPDINVNIVAVQNRFFGETVTVAGLVVGGDIAETLSNRTDIGDVLLLPKVMLKETEDVFLDGMKLEELKKITKKDIIVISDGYELCQTILECE